MDDGRGGRAVGRGCVQWGVTGRRWGRWLGCGDGGRGEKRPPGGGGGLFVWFGVYLGAEVLEGYHGTVVIFELVIVIFPYFRPVLIQHLIKHEVVAFSQSGVFATLYAVNFGALLSEVGDGFLQPGKLRLWGGCRALDGGEALLWDDGAGGAEEAYGLCGAFGGGEEAGGLGLSYEGGELCGEAGVAGEGSGQGREGGGEEEGGQESREDAAGDGLDHGVTFLFA